MSSPFDCDSQATVREQAAAWFARRRAADWQAGEAGRLEAWLAADARHRREYEQLAALWTAVGDLADSPVVRAERSPARRSAFGWRPVLALAFLFLLAFGLARLLPLPGPALVQSVATRPGELRTIALDDGSRIHLDADSAVSIRVAATRQTVVLERGEAFFDVVHRPDRRFEVEAGAGRIVDIGTRFGVRREGSRVVVGVAEGEVEFVAEKWAPAKHLTAGQGVVIAGDGAVGEPFPWDADGAFAWRDGRLVFDRTPLGEAVARINRYWREPLAVADPALSRLRLSGSFRIEDAPGLLWALEQTLPLRAVRRGGHIDLVALGADEAETPPQLIQ